jgi:hypothetical protein
LILLLYRCYEVLGDRTALIMEDRRLRRALREALADPEDPEDDPTLYAPHAETVQLFETILGRLGGSDSILTAGSAAKVAA